MEKRIVKAVMAEKQMEISRLQLVERPIRFDAHANYVIVGVRRAGKSYQMFQDIKGRMASGEMRFEDWSGFRRRWGTSVR